MADTLAPSIARLAVAHSSVPWPTRYKALLIAMDVVVVLATMMVAVTVAGIPWGLDDTPSLTDPSGVVVGTATAAIWLLLLAGGGSRSPRVVGTGATEYRRVGQSTLIAFAVSALLAYVLDIPHLRGFFGVGIAVGFVLALACRFLARRWLVAQRADGRMMRSVLLVGSPGSISSVARDVERNTAAGFKVIGACTPSGLIADTVPGTSIPISGSIDNLPRALAATGADTVIITSANELSPGQVRQLSWQLEPGRQHLVVAPSLTDIAGPRLHIRPVNGLPLVHVETPRYEGGKLRLKRVFDAAASATLLLLLSPALIVVALLVRASSEGPVFFRQPRIGLRGERFEMLKFRSMYVDAEERLAELTATDEGNGVMFKMRDDPRVTPIGRLLRRYSLDELPQLINVLFGSMSLVGPRPPLEREVVQYSSHVHRRFLVKPGITGLWQVSGRSDLDWEATVRLDLFYVENWTFTGDLHILARTARAIFAGEGAY